MGLRSLVNARPRKQGEEKLSKKSLECEAKTGWLCWATLAKEVRGSLCANLGEGGYAKQQNGEQGIWGGGSSVL